MSKHFFDFEDGDFAHSIYDNMAIDSDGDLLMRMGDNMAMDMDSGGLTMKMMIKIAAAGRIPLPTAVVV